MIHLFELYLRFCNTLAGWAPWSMFALLGLPAWLAMRIKRPGIDN